MPLTLSTWNINSVRARIEIVEQFLTQESPDILCLQETKVRDEEFPGGLFRRLGYTHQIKDARVGEIAMANVVPVLSATPGGIDGLGPPLGAHTDDILGRLLGLTAATLRDLREKGVV